MKTALLFTLALIFSLSGLSQVPDYFGNEPRWRVDHFGQPDCIFQTKSDYYVAGDSIIGEVTYKILDKQYYTTYDNYSMDPYVTCPDPSWGTALEGLYRQEDRKIYRWVSYLDEEELVIDYDLEVGDPVLGWGSEQATVTGIEELIINGEVHKVFYYDDDQSSYFVEGIGNRMELFGAYNGITLNGGSSFVCYSQMGETVYQDESASDEGCYFNVSIEEELSLVAPSVYPNPAEKKLVIEGSGAESFEIYSALGKFQESGVLTGLEIHEVSLSDYAVGVYVISFKKSTGSIHQVRFIKE